MDNCTPVAPAVRDGGREEDLDARVGVVHVDILQRHDLELLQRQRVLRVVDVAQDFCKTKK
jgi:hypothetical protein